MYINEDLKKRFVENCNFFIDFHLCVEEKLGQVCLRVVPWENWGLDEGVTFQASRYGALCQLPGYDSR